jgi:hypothetical protein
VNPEIINRGPGDSEVRDFPLLGGEQICSTGRTVEVKEQSWTVDRIHEVEAYLEMGS